MTSSNNNITSQAIILLALNSLELDTENPRKTGSKSAADDMVASIKDKGLLQPLSVIEHPTKDGKYIVKIGNRRLRALRQLAKDGHLDPSEDSIRCQTLTGSKTQVQEAQLAENMVRQAMNAVDEYEAFAKLVDAGENPEDIAARFGTTVRNIKSRMALGKCAPVIRNALRNDEITLDAAKAYAGCPDHARQVRIYKSYQGRGWGGTNYNEVKSALNESRFTTTSPMGQFISIDNYIERGGEIEQDLISEEGTFLNTELVYELRDERLAAEMTKLSEEGWLFVEVHEARVYDYYTNFQMIYGDVSPLSNDEENELKQLTAKLEALEAKYDDSGDEWTEDDINECEGLEQEIQDFTDRPNTFSDELKATCGVFIYPGISGEIGYQYGMQRKSDIKGDANSNADNDNVTPKKRFSDSLKTDIASYRGFGIRAALIQNPELAQDFLIFNTLYAVYESQWSSGSSAFGQKLHVRAEIPAYEDLPSTKIITKAETSVKSDIFDDDIYASWQRFLKITPKQRLALIAHAISQTIHDTSSQDSFTSQVTADLGVSLRDYWTPGYEDYFSRIRKDQIFDHVQEFVGEEQCNDLTKSRKIKKDDAARLAANIVSGKFPIADAYKDAVAAWVPDELDYQKHPAARKTTTRKRAA